MAHLAARRPDLYERHRGEIWAMCAAGDVRPVVHETLPLDQAARAHRVIEERRNQGKVVLAPGAR